MQGVRFLTPTVVVAMSKLSKLGNPATVFHAQLRFTSATQLGHVSFWTESQASAIDQYVKANGLFRSAEKLMQVKEIGTRTIEINGKTLTGERGVKIQLSNFTVVPDCVAGFLVAVWSVWHIKNMTDYLSMHSVLWL